MNLLCPVGLHKWQGCKCARCGKTRDEGHNWRGCKRSNCGKTRDEGHEWSKDCEKCARCGSCKHEWHPNWNVATVSYSGRRFLWVKGTAEVTTFNYHGCRCTKCGRMQDHSYVEVATREEIESYASPTTVRSITDVVCEFCGYETSTSSGVTSGFNSTFIQALVSISVNSGLERT